ncbi:hypothetical protein PSPO01_09950 [Paraphaeosphaeria sporulosa]
MQRLPCEFAWWLKQASATKGSNPMGTRFPNRIEMADFAIGLCGGGVDSGTARNLSLSDRGPPNKISPALGRAVLAAGGRACALQRSSVDPDRRRTTIGEARDREKQNAWVDAACGSANAVVVDARCSNAPDVYVQRVNSLALATICALQDQASGSGSLALHGEGLDCRPDGRHQPTANVRFLFHRHLSGPASPSSGLPM